MGAVKKVDEWFDRLIPIVLGRSSPQNHRCKEKRREIDKSDDLLLKFKEDSFAICVQSGESSRTLERRAAGEAGRLSGKPPLRQDCDVE